ncbi:hypothetical protein JYU34_003054 [Plutella xylostella]|uniref:Uncharacterized protein n=1 Tax=Plutella xylostella TaxID=51655 RepID=A0ABQ7QZ19_PLUXY|nr:hypothetical protein JYU34_003054 [Plutella xylostella]
MASEACNGLKLDSGVEAAGQPQPHTWKANCSDRAGTTTHKKLQVYVFTLTHGSSSVVSRVCRVCRVCGVWRGARPGGPAAAVCGGSEGTSRDAKRRRTSGRRRAPAARSHPRRRSLRPPARRDDSLRENSNRHVFREPLELCRRPGDAACEDASRVISCGRRSMVK